MIAELGHYALVLALALALIQSVVPLIGARLRDPALMGVAIPTALAQFAFVAAAFVALSACYAVSDFADDVALNVKRHPLKSTAITFGVAFGAGAVAAWFSRRK